MSKGEGRARNDDGLLKNEAGERALELSGKEGTPTASTAGGGSQQGKRKSKSGGRRQAEMGPVQVQWKV